jgi:hypothetical protein
MPDSVFEYGKYGEGILTTIEITQNTHLHPLAAARKPPVTGPMTGPIRTPRVSIAIAKPRSSYLTISATMAQQRKSLEATASLSTYSDWSRERKRRRR